MRLVFRGVVVGYRDAVTRHSHPEGARCELCGDTDSTMFLLARCHPTAPLLARKEGKILILSCYVPTCGREVARLQLAEDAPMS